LTLLYIFFNNTTPN